MATGYSSWTEVGNKLRAHGVARVYVKQLAPRQDNEKNQVYLARQKGASAFELIEHILPLTFTERAASTSTAKERSHAGEPILEGTVPWNWVDRDGTAHHAPRTKVIFYLQYPEIRLSGFLDGCKNAPDAMRRNLLAKFGSRALVFGTGSSGEVYALVVTEQEDPALFTTNLTDGAAAASRGTKRKSAMRIAGLTRHPRNSALYYFEVITDGLSRLLDDLKKINAAGWHPCQRLKDGPPPIPYKGTNAGGYTLESVLGIPSNAKKEPDRDGVEVKSFSQNKVSLMTPTPDGGIQGDAGFLSFMKAFGKVDPKDPDRINFNGVHVCNVCSDTGLTLTVSGYGKATGFTGSVADVVVSLIQHTTGIVACSWSYPRLFESWNKKHSKAVYVSSARQERSGDTSHPWEYHFADTVWVCEGTSSRHLLDAIIAGEVVYDPGDTTKSKSTGKPKVRPQWRVRNLKSLASLYDKVSKAAFP